MYLYVSKFTIDDYVATLFIVFYIILYYVFQK